VTTEPERESEVRARRALESVLGRQLTRFRRQPEHSRAETPDYTDDGNEAYEVKQVTSKEFRELNTAIRDLPFFESSALTKHWLVGISAPTMADRFRPMPDFPDDDPELIAALEADGFKVTRKTELEAAWSKRFSGTDRQAPRITNLAPDLEPHLLVMERAGITNTREAQPMTREQQRALAWIAQSTHGAICMAHEPFDGRAGITIKFGYGYVRSGPDTLAFRVQAFLDSEWADNLRQSLWPEFARRHGVLVFDSSEPEYWSANEAGRAFVPTADLTLPDEIDVVWCLVGRLLLRFERGDAWQSFALAAA
jgi:hypothetical protein